MFRALAACALLACSAPPRTGTTTFDDVAARFDELAVRVTKNLERWDPAEAVSLGLHAYDGQVPDRSPAALDAMALRLAQDHAALVAAEPASDRERLEREILLTAVAEARFQLVELDAYRTNPLAYTAAINLDAYIVRDYAPLPERGRAVVALCTALPGYLAQARANLRLPMPRPWIDTAVLQTTGLVEFADRDVRGVLADLADVGPALDGCKRALAEHAAWLQQQQPSGTAAFALGRDRFLRMLAVTQGVEIDLERLEAIAQADLARNLAAVEAAARAIDPAKPARDVILAQAEDKPEAADVLQVATDQTEQMRRFVIDHAIVSIPSDEPALVRETPAFQRWNAASLDAPGPFEPKPLPTFYYISPPDPKWPVAEQRAYIIPRNDLLFTTIHEVWPGHFLQRLHRKRLASRIAQAYCTYTNVEGWAHYTEEMMFDAGAGAGAPQSRIGMLKEALLRNARFVVAIGEHARGMTLDEARRVFEERAFVDPGNARQQAVRGTFDPMFLSYTLGKLMIRKLRVDWEARHPGKTARAFHDAFLAYGCAPIPVIRRLMLGADAGPAI